MLDVRIAHPQAERQRGRRRGARAAFADFDLQRADAQRLEEELPAQRREEVRVRADLARFDPQSVGLEPNVLEGDDARQGAVRALDPQRRPHFALHALERPAKPGFRAEKPADRRRGADEDHRKQDDSAGEDGAQLQKPYPTEKCSRQSLFKAP